MREPRVSDPRADRFDYSSALSESWKYQTLLNIVKLRYMDIPVFIDVAQVVSGYQLTTQLNANGTVGPGGGLPGNFATFGAAGQYTDRPTITYTPLTGDQFIRGMMTPLRPEAVFFSLLSGNSADVVFFTSVVVINGLANQRYGGTYDEPTDPGFFRFIELARKLQKSGAFGFRIQENKEKDTTKLFFFRKDGLSLEERDAIQECKQLLKLDPEAQEFRLAFGATPESNREVAVQTRSLIQIMLEVASQIDLPEAHVAEGRATSGIPDRPGEQGAVRFMRIQASPIKSKDAFLSISYRNLWFWIDDRDIKTKRNFAFLMYLFALADTGAKQPLPLITIPAQ
jgi:hypothetical protein